MQIVFKVNVVTETFPLDDISDASGKVHYRNVRPRTVITASTPLYNVISKVFLYFPHTLDNSHSRMKDGCCSSSTDLSISIVAKGKPQASTKDCRASRKPARTAKTPGRVHAVWAPCRAAIIASVTDWKILGSLVGGSMGRALLTTIWSAR